MKKGRKKTGGRYIPSRKKKKYELGKIQRVVKLAKTKAKKLRTRGGTDKTVLLSCDKANMIVNGKSQLVDIKNVLETSSNRFWARQNRLVKGAIIETSAGKAKITNRPGQEGCVNATLIKEEKERADIKTKSKLKK